MHRLFLCIMGLLNHLFASTEAIAGEAEADEESIRKKWNEYLKTIPLKKEIIDKLHPDRQFLTDLKDLKRLLGLELVDIHNEEKDERELIADLEHVEHSKKVRRVQRLEQCLGYAETKYEYTYKLLEHLYSVLKTQMRLVEKLLANPKDFGKLISRLKSQFELEAEIISKIQKIETFHELFLALAKGEHIIRRMDAREKRLVKKMQRGLSRIFANEINEGITCEWALTVFSQIEDRVHEGVANGIYPGYHPDIDFEFANRPEFIVLVREVIQSIRKRAVSEQMVNAFVYLFREWYNHERD